MLVLILLLRLRGNVSRQRQEAKRRAVVGRMLDLAQTQNEIFKINVLDGQARKGLAGLLHASATDNSSWTFFLTLRTGSQAFPQKYTFAPPCQKAPHFTNFTPPF